MALIQATLADGLAALEPTEDEAGAIQAFADAWEAYFGDAMVGSTSVVPGTLAAARAALVAALSGLNAPSGGATVLQAAIVAWWGAVAASAAAIWAGNAPPVLSATPPPGLSGIAAALEPVFASNTASRLDLSSSAAAIAAVLHPLQLGGLTAVGPPPGSVPIL